MQVPCQESGRTSLRIPIYLEHVPPKYFHAPPVRSLHLFAHHHLRLVLWKNGVSAACVQVGVVLAFYVDFMLTRISLSSSALIRRPLLASCGTAAVLFGAGDVIAQQAVEKRGNKHDVSWD